MIALLILAGVWAGCTPEKRYKTLSFFFDGVPDPKDAAIRAAGGTVVGRGAGGERIVVFTHKPYADDNCTACHEGGVSTLFRPVPGSVQPTVCLKCHEDIPRRYPIMHGPVASVECLWCHAPHEGNDKALLRDKSPAICLQCHTTELLSTTPIEHTQPSADCLVCHVGHGGEKHGLLRADWIAPAPLRSPSTLPTGNGGGGGKI